MNNRQRAGLADTLRDLANYGVTALGFSQFVGGGLISWPLIVVAAAMWLLLVGFAVVLEGE